MKTLLVLAEHPELAESVRHAVDPERYRVVHRANLEEAEPMLVHGLADLCVLDAGLDSVKGVWSIERLRRRDPRHPVIVCANSRDKEWEEEAFLRGASYVVAKPLQPRLFSLLIERLAQSPTHAPAAHAISPPAATPAQPALAPYAESTRSTDTAHYSASATLPSLSVLRDFSSILTHSLDAHRMLRQFLLLLRELLGVNRGVIFLKHPPTAYGGLGGTAEPSRLRAACSVGLAPSLLEHFNLSLESGIGGHLMRLGRILRRNGEEARRDTETQKEFELLGGQVAVPVLDRETLVGVAVFDGHVTGEALSNAELEFLFHLLEQLGLAVRNIWLHEQLAANHETLTGILRELSSACIVINRDLGVVHANKAARKLFQQERHGDTLSFSDLPQVLGTKMYQVLSTGSAVANFRYEPEHPPGTVYRVNVVPFQRDPAGLPSAALLTMEDLTHSEQLRRLEVEASNLRLIRSMAERLVHEIGNAMVPLSTHQQLLSDKWRDAEFRASLDGALADGVKRVNRLLHQMRYLAWDQPLQKESFPLAPLLEEAYQEACRHQPSKASQLRYEAPPKSVMVSGDRAALKHALSEVMLNALQANPGEPKVGVRFASPSNGAAAPRLTIEVQDNGGGFTQQSAQSASDPFFTTRNVGLGLGLTVSRKIIECHQGKLEILPPQSGESGIVRISLPLESALVA